MDEHIQELGLANVKAHDIIDILGDYIGLGYGKSTKKEQGKITIRRSYDITKFMSFIFLILALIADVVSNTGLSLDPTFTAKGLLGLVTEMKENPGSFQGKRVLFIHTGMYDTLCKLFNWKCTLMIIFLGGFEG